MEYKTMISFIKDMISGIKDIFTIEPSEIEDCPQIKYNQAIAVTIITNELINKMLKEKQTMTKKRIVNWLIRRKFLEHLISDDGSYDPFDRWRMEVLARYLRGENNE